MQRPLRHPSRLAASLFTLFAAALGATACSGSSLGIGDGPGDLPPPGSVTTTSVVVPQTIAGVCQKYAALTCAEPNCEALLTLASQECSSPADNFQDVIDCLAAATFTCSGSPPSAQVPDCNGQLERVTACANGNEPPVVATPPTTTTPPSVSPSGGCQDSSSCTAWSCLCEDGYSLSLAVCSSGTCEGPTYVCSASNPSAVSACAGHGGVL